MQATNLACPSKPSRRTRQLRTIPVALLALCAVSSVHAQPPDRSRSSESAAGHPDFGGTWERYVPPRDPNAGPAPGPTGVSGALGPTFAGPPTPLKPEYAAAYAADVRRRQDAERRGEPIANANAQCIPDGM